MQASVERGEGTPSLAICTPLGPVQGIDRHLAEKGHFVGFLSYLSKYVNKSQAQYQTWDKLLQAVNTQISALSALMSTSG